MTPLCEGQGDRSESEKDTDRPSNKPLARGKRARWTGAGEQGAEAGIRVGTARRKSAPRDGCAESRREPERGP